MNKEEFMIKLMVLILFSLPLFAKTDISLNSDGAEKYFTQEEMDKGLSWLVNLSGSKSPSPSKIPFIKLYDSKEFKGKEIGEITKDGLFLNGVKLCHFEEVWGGIKVLIDEKPLRRGMSEKLRSYGGVGDQRHLCEAFPLRRPEYDDSGTEGTSYDMRVRVFDGKVGRFKSGEVTYYFDLKDILKEASRIEKDTETILKENLSDDEMKALNKSLVELRVFLKTATLEQLYERVRNGRDGNDVLVHKRIFTFKTRKELFERVKDEKTFLKDVLRSTYVNFLLMTRQEVARSKHGKFFWLENSSVGLSYEYYDGEWRISQLIALSYLK